jgi:hypothetical protein
LLPANNLSVAYDHANSALLDGQSYPRDMLWITSPQTGKVFRNSLDDFLPTPIQLDTIVYLQDLLPNQQLNIKGIRVEVFGVPTTEPAVNTIISPNIGSQADPIHIHLDLAEDQLVLGDSSLKAFIFYDTSARVIPEPATAALLWTAIAGVVSLRRRLR